MNPGNPPSALLFDRLLPGRRTIRLLWLLAIAAVVIGSLLPSKSLLIRKLEAVPLSDKAEHAGMYALLAFLPVVREPRRVALAAALGAVALGVGLEYAQLLTGWREFEVADMIADAAGVALGFAAGLAARLCGAGAA